MKISMEHFPIRAKFGEEKALTMIKEAGFDAVDYSFNQLGNGTPIDLSDHIKKAEKLRKTLDALSLSCTQAHAPFGLPYGMKFDLTDRHFADTVRSFEFAAVLGVKQVVVHSIDVPVNTDFTLYNLAFYQALEPYAKNAGVQIAVENLVSSVFWRPNRLSHFIRLLDSPVFCACIDMGHAALTGIPPEDFIAGMDRGILKCVHMQDTDGKTDRHWIPYQGVQNWDAIVKALAAYGYDGEMDLEIIHCFDSLPDELYFPLMCYAARVGKTLADKFAECS